MTPTPEPRDPAVDPPADPRDPTDPTDTGENPHPEEPGIEASEPAPPVAVGGAGTVTTFFWQIEQRSYVPVLDDQFVVTDAPTFTFDVLANASATAPATLDPEIIDLDPSTPGVQRSVETEVHCRQRRCCVRHRHGAADGGRALQHH